MATTETATERDAIVAVIDLYVEGASKGKLEPLEQAFDARAWMFGAAGGQRMDMPIRQLFELATQMPLDSDGSYRAEVLSVDQVGDAAQVRLAEDGCWGGVSFVDLFTLAKIDGDWKIVNKTFVHTGGEMPSAG
jgi:hypothetical protein